MLGKRDGKIKVPGNFYKRQTNGKSNIYTFGIFVLMVHVELKGALEADGPEMLSIRALVLLGSHDQLRKKTGSNLYFLYIC